MVVQIVIIAAKVHIAPSLKRPVELVVNAGTCRIIKDRPVTALAKPLHRRMFHGEQIVGGIVHCHVFGFGVAFHDHAGQHRVGHFRSGKFDSHELGRPEIAEFRLPLGRWCCRHGSAPAIGRGLIGNKGRSVATCRKEGQRAIAAAPSAAASRLLCVLNSWKLCVRLYMLGTDGRSITAHGPRADSDSAS